MIFSRRRVGRCDASARLFNPLCERWSTPGQTSRKALPYLNAFETGSEARAGIGTWISYYNEKRPHSSHGLLTPSEAYDAPPQTLKAAAWT